MTEAPSTPREVAGLRQRYELVIDGQHSASVRGRYFQTVDPATGEVLAEAAAGDAQDIDRAVRSADRTVSGSWGQTSPVQRGRVLAATGRLLQQHEDELAMLECLDSGQPLSQARGDIRTAARYFEYYAGLADKIEGAQIPLDAHHLAFTTKEPYGVVGVIVPWNAPLNQAARSVAPALAAGNACVVKPAEQTPLSAVRLGELAIEAGLPAGVLNVVTGFGADAGQALAEHPLVRKVSFTGSVETGRLVARIAADRLVPSSLELGGKSPNIIFADADVAAVVASVLRTVTRKAGQICSAATRLLVENRFAAEIVDATVEALKGVTMGPGVEDPMLGPLVSEVQLQRVLGLMQAGTSAGATVAAGGGRASEGRLANGFFVEPTVFTSVSPDMPIAQQEIFGPVVSVIGFDDEDEAVAIANGTPYGLAAGVYTRDIGRALSVSRRLQAGQVFVNDYQAGGVETPFGGYKASGWGREKGTEAINHYTQLKTTILAF